MSKEEKREGKKIVSYSKIKTCLANSLRINRGNFIWHMVTTFLINSLSKKINLILSVFTKASLTNLNNRLSFNS